MEGRRWTSFVRWSTEVVLQSKPSMVTGRWVSKSIEMKPQRRCGISRGWSLKKGFFAPIFNYLTGDASKKVGVEIFCFAILIKVFRSVQHFRIGKMFCNCCIMYEVQDVFDVSSQNADFSGYLKKDPSIVIFGSTCRILLLLHRVNRQLSVEGLEEVRKDLVLSIWIRHPVW